jgi:hypothetical protein
MWSLWMARNRRRHGEEALPVKIAVQWAKDSAFDLWQPLHPAKAVDTSQHGQQFWQHLAPGWIKGNVDAAFYSRDRSASSDVVLRDHEGKACGGRAKWYDQCLNTLALKH